MKKLLFISLVAISCNTDTSKEPVKVNTDSIAKYDKNKAIDKTIDSLETYKKDTENRYDNIASLTKHGLKSSELEKLSNDQLDSTMKYQVDKAVSDMRK